MVQALGRVMAEQTSFAPDDLWQRGRNTAGAHSALLFDTAVEL